MDLKNFFERARKTQDIIIRCQYLLALFKELTTINIPGELLQFERSEFSFKELERMSLIIALVFPEFDKYVIFSENIKNKLLGDPIIEDIEENQRIKIIIGKEEIIIKKKLKISRGWFQHFIVQPMKELTKLRDESHLETCPKYCFLFTFLITFIPISILVLIQFFNTDYLINISNEMIREINFITGIFFIFIIISLIIIFKGNSILKYCLLVILILISLNFIGIYIKFDNNNNYLNELIINLWEFKHFQFTLENTLNCHDWNNLNSTYHNSNSPFILLKPCYELINNFILKYPKKKIN